MIPKLHKNDQDDVTRLVSIDKAQSFRTLISKTANFDSFSLHTLPHNLINNSKFRSLANKMHFQYP
jgi:hypothetical protein